jgi:hypothetical protein
VFLKQLVAEFRFSTPNAPPLTYHSNLPGTDKLLNRLSRMSRAIERTDTLRLDLGLRVCQRF